MTVRDTQTPRTPPRALVRTFWAIHRTVFGLTKGRLGTWRPRSGKRFGAMALTTTGRRSGEPRRVMVGYFEDGNDLVTLAMKGWADAPPAWWLNLEANPEATVVTRDGRRQVRARVAVGEERDRLWARFDEFPGWGDELETRRMSRQTGTPVVVFETMEVK